MRKVKGFTLVEVIISTVIIGILATGIFAMVSYSKRMSIRTQQKAAAVSIVEKKLNELRSGGVSSLPTVGVHPDPVPVVISTAGASTTTGVLTTTVQDATPPDPRMKEVKVELNWGDPFGAQRTESAVTVFYQE